MTLQEYLTNPLGKGDSSLPGRELIIQSLTGKYYELDRKKGKLIKEMVYHDPTNGDFYIHLIMPSETERDNTYDVVVRLFDNSHKELSLSKYDVQFFTNTPSYVYTFAYVYHEYGLSIQFLESKNGNKAVTKPPIVRNQFEVVSYDKYLFFAAKYIQDSRMLNRALLTARAHKFSKNALLKKVRTNKQIMVEYEQAAGKLREHKNYVKMQDKKAATRPRRISITADNPVGTVGHDGNRVGHVKPTRSIKPKRKTGNRVHKK